MASEKDLLFPIVNKKEYVFAKNNLVNMYISSNVLQANKAEQSSANTTSGNLFFDSKFYVPYVFSYSGLYNSIAYSTRVIKENNYDTVSNQKYVGIWKTLSPTSSVNDIQQQTERVQYIGLSNYYFNDEIANGTFRLYYLPIIDTTSSSLSALQSQNVYRNFDIHKDFFGASFAVTGSASVLKTNLTGASTGLSVEILFRPIPQNNNGYFFHRWTTNSASSVMTTFNESTSSLSSDYPFYSAHPYYGVGATFNYLTPIIDTDNESPYIEFYVYGHLSSSTSHYLNLSSNTINQQTHTRFNLTQNLLNILFDGAFHSFRFVWSTEDYYKHGRIFLDNLELNQDSISGTGRTTPISYALSGNTITQPYFLSKLDNPLNPFSQQPTKFPVYCEAKHLLMFDKAISGTVLNQSVSSNNQAYSLLGSTTSNLGIWFGFNSITSSATALDLVQQFSIKSNSTSGFIVNDLSSLSNPEGKIDKVYSLLYDKYGNTAPSINDSSTSESSLQNSVGRIFSSEYGVSASNHIGYIFYDAGNVGIFNDNYNNEYSKSTQLFISSTSTQFSTSTTSDRWKIEYLSFVGRQYTNRILLSITADANYFCKSTNHSSIFKGTDQKNYTKMNTKTINGILWYDSKGFVVAQTKFSNPIIKKEHNSIIIQTNIDL